MIDVNDIEILRKDAFRVDRESYSELMSSSVHNNEKRIYTSPESIGNCAYILIKKGVNLDGAMLDTAKMYGTVLSNISFKKTSLSGADFKGVTLSNVSFFGATLSYANFENANLQEVDFSQAIIQKTNFVNANMDNKTIESIAKSQYWGSAKLSDSQRSKVEKAYQKAGTLNVS